MRLVFVMQFLGCGGAERVVSILMDYFVEKKYDVSLVLLYKNAINYSINEKVHVYELNWSRKCNVLKQIKQATSLRGYIDDAVVVSFLFNSIFYSTLASVGLNNCLIFSERNDPRKDPDGRMKRIARNLCYLYAKTIVFQTGEQREYFCKRIRYKGVIVKNPITRAIPVDYKVENAKKRVITIARLEKQKNIKMGIDAFELFYSNHGEYTYHIYGNGSLKNEIEQYIYSKNLADAIRLHDYTTDIFEEMKKATVFILASDYEGISNAMLEAMVMGVPVICTDCPVGGGRETIKNGYNGFLVPVNGYREMANYLNIIAEDFSLRKKISSNSRKIFELCNKEVICSEWEEVLLQQNRGLN